MKTRSGLARGILPLALLVGLVAGCSQGERQAAEASTDAISAEPSSVGALVDGSRICLINKSSHAFQIEPVVYEEKSSKSSVNPGDDYCQAGYVSGDSGIDTDLRAVNESTALHIFAENPSLSSAYAAVKFIAQGNYERNLVFSTADPGQHKMGTTSDGRFALDLYRVDDCCGWKQWRLEIFDAPSE